MHTVSSLVTSLGRFSTRIAVVDHTTYRRIPTSYHELSLQIERCCALLSSMKVRKGDRIILWGPNSTEWISVFLAAQYLGIIVVPIDLRNSTAFVRRVQKQVKATAAFCTRWKPSIHKRTIVLEELEAALPARQMLPVVKISPSDVSQLIYTSGTTGNPKGVILTHENVMTAVQGAVALRGTTHLERNLLLAPLSHSLGSCAILGALLCGATTSITTISTPRITSAIALDLPTSITLVPRILEVLTAHIKDAVQARIGPGWNGYVTVGKSLPWLLRRAWFHDIRMTLGKDLREIICGGAPLSSELEELWDRIGIPILQGYGLTETAALTSLNTLTHRRIGSVGKIISGARVRIMDGEIHIKGAHVTVGYYQNRSATRLVLRDGWFATGDLGRIDTDGYLYVTGRAKDVIIPPSGIKVYPQDIEDVLRAERGVRDCVVVGKETPRGEEVHAIITLDPAMRRSIDDIITSANRRLDSTQQIHSSSIWHEPDFPRTPTAKIKRYSLKEWIEKKHATRDTVDAVSTSSQDRLNALIAQASGTPLGKIRPASKLTRDLGLDSIGRAELVSLIETEFGVEIPEDSITHTTTVSTLATLIRSRRMGSAIPYPQWTQSRVLNLLRYALWWMSDTFVRNRLRITVNKINNIPAGPCILIANHTSHLDVPTLFSILDRSQKRQFSVATWAEYFIGEDLIVWKRWSRAFLLRVMTLGYHCILFPQQHGIRLSLRRIGERLDSGGIVLVFPEGRRTRDGKIGVFKPGIGFLALEMGVPIVPIRIDGLYDSLPYGSWFPRRGTVCITVGKPRKYLRGEPDHIATELENIVKKL